MVGGGCSGDGFEGDGEGEPVRCVFAADDARRREGIVGEEGVVVEGEAEGVSRVEGVGGGDVDEEAVGGLVSGASREEAEGRCVEEFAGAVGGDSGRAAAFSGHAVAIGRRCRRLSRESGEGRGRGSIGP